MPQLTDGHHVLAHLRGAFRENSGCWTFVTDSPTGHLRLCTLASVAYLAFALPESAMGFGACDWIDGSTGMRFSVSFLTLPKDRVPRDVVRGFVAGIGRDLDDEQDVIAIAKDDPAELTRFINAIVNGDATPIPTGSMN